VSWDELEQLGQTEDIREAKQQREDLARLCLRVFSSEDGQKLLEWLRQMYVDVPIAVPGTDASYAYFADGQRAVVRDLEARVKQARSI
jgi:hypothetical protein